MRQSCLRGVVLSAAELGDSSRFSTISVDEDSVLEGNCEEIIIEGVTHILEDCLRCQRPCCCLQAVSIIFWERI